MAFANGIVLAIGALLIGVPIVLHLLMQPKPKLLTFPALRFVRQKQHSNRRQMQMRHWLLLLLRCLLVAAVVMALAGLSSASTAFASWSIVGLVGFVALLSGLLLVATFIWTQPLNKLLVVVFALLLAVSLITATALGINTARNPSQQVLGNRIAPVSAVMLIDTSPRMQYLFDNQTRMAGAQEMTKWLIEQLPEDSQVSVAIPDGSEPFFSIDISAAEKRIETLATDFGADPLPTSIPPALKLLSESQNDRRELYILSDLTARSWRDTNGLKELLEQNPDVTVYVIDVGAVEPTNATVGPIEFSSEVISLSSQLEIVSEVRTLGKNQGGVATMYIEKSDQSRPFRADGKTMLPNQFIQRQKIIDPSESSSSPLRFVLEDRLEPGTHHGWIEFESGDGLDLDDRRFFTIQMRKAWDVLVVAPRGVSTDNLVENLSPYSYRQAGTQEYDCKVIEQNQFVRFNTKDMSKYKAVFFLDPAPLAEGSWNVLADFAGKGGGVVFFLGGNAGERGQIDPSFASPSAKRLMPGEVTREFRAPNSSDPEMISDGSVFLTLNSSTHPIVKPFTRSASRIRWELLPVHQHWGMRSFEGQQAGSEVLFRFSNQQPAIVEKQVGLGRVIVMLTPITEPSTPKRRNDLFFDMELCWPAFILVRSIADHLVAIGPTRLNLLMGETALLENDRTKFPEQYRLFAPRDEEPVRIESDKGQIRYKFTDYPGQYRLKGNLDGVVLRGFSVNLRDGETDLNRVEQEQLETWLGKGRFQIGREREEIEREQGTMRVGREFYPILVTLLAVLLGLELLVSNRFYHQKPARTLGSDSTA